jgi:adenine-specific DNA-methyltransferase
VDLYGKLIELLKTDLRFVDDSGELVLATVQNSAWKMDHALIRLLLSNSKIGAMFFDDIDGCRVFNMNTFIDYMSQKDFLDNSYTRFKNRIGLTTEGKFIGERGEVSLAWPYKDCVLEGGQTKEEESRKEILFNEVLAHDEINRLFDPKVLTNFARHTAKGNKKMSSFKRDENGVIRENLILKGNNLLAMHVLQSNFHGQVKLIYIDPPYNTDNDSFRYNDKFKHSTWLTFMHNRLEIARELLSQTGAIFIHVDYLECAYLKVLCDEVFGRENFVQTVTVRSATPAGFKVVNPGPVNVSEFILEYTKSKKNYSFKHSYVAAPYQKDYKFYVTNPSEDSTKWVVGSVEQASIAELGFDDLKAVKRQYGGQVASLLVEQKMSDFAEANASHVFATYGPHKPSGILKDLIAKSKKQPNKILYHEREGNSPFILQNGRLFAFYDKKMRTINGKKVPTKILTDFWDDLSWDTLSFEGGVTLKNGKKPEALLQRIIDMGTDKADDIVLDFFLGSGTTCAVAHKMGRQYIGIEQLDYAENDSIVRLENVVKGDKSGISKSVDWHGGGEFVSCELMKYNEAFMDRIQDATSSKELLAVWKQMAKDSFLNWYVKPVAPKGALEDFKAIGNGLHGLENQKKKLTELLDKNQLYVNLSEIDDAQFKVSKEDKQLNKTFYGEV